MMPAKDDDDDDDDDHDDDDAPPVLRRRAQPTTGFVWVQVSYSSCENRNDKGQRSVSLATGKNSTANHFFMQLSVTASNKESIKGKITTYLRGKSLGTLFPIGYSADCFDIFIVLDANIDSRERPTARSKAVLQNMCTVMPEEFSLHTYITADAGDDEFEADMLIARAQSSTAPCIKFALLKNYTRAHISASNMTSLRVVVNQAIELISDSLLQFRRGQNVRALDRCFRQFKWSGIFMVKSESIQTLISIAKAKLSQQLIAESN